MRRRSRSVACSALVSESNFLRFACPPRRQATRRKPTAEITRPEKRKNAKMRTTVKPVFYGTKMTKDVAHNLTAITDRGSYISTQVWEHSAKAAAAVAMEWYQKGEAGRGESHPWNEPIIAVFIQEHGDDGQLFHYDCLNPMHIETLRQMVLLPDPPKSGFVRQYSNITVR